VSWATASAILSASAALRAFSGGRDGDQAVFSTSAPGFPAEAGELLDFTKPVALMFVGCLHHLPDSDDPVSLVARYLTALAPGSYLILSHATDEFAPERTDEASAGAAQRGAIWIPRGKDAILRMFNGLELLDPGLVLVSYWRPEGGVPDPNAARAWVYGGIARA
jgi:SAM-dependent methyltransferase